MTSKDLDKELEWVDERFLKSIGRIHYLCLIERGYNNGYEIMDQISEQYHVKLSTAAVYPVLQTLEEDGYILGEWVKGTHPQKKKYTLTRQGKSLLKAARTRIHNLVNSLSQHPRRRR